MYVILHVFTMLFWGFPARPAKSFGLDMAIDLFMWFDVYISIYGTSPSQ